MNRIRLDLKAQFNADLQDSFKRRAVYYPSMDFLQYVAEDTTAIADRVDEFLTLIWDAQQDRLIGFKLNGFRCVYKKHVKPEMSGASFDPIVTTLEAVATQLEDDLFGEELEETNRAYSDASELARRDLVHIS